MFYWSPFWIIWERTFKNEQVQNKTKKKYATNGPTDIRTSCQGRILKKASFE